LLQELAETQTMPDTTNLFAGIPDKLPEKPVETLGLSEARQGE